jgi:hypothetical protein
MAMLNNQRVTLDFKTNCMFYTFKHTQVGDGLPFFLTHRKLGLSQTSDPFQLRGCIITVAVPYKMYPTHFQIHQNMLVVYPIDIPIEYSIISSII